MPHSFCQYLIKRNTKISLFQPFGTKVLSPYFITVLWVIYFFLSPFCAFIWLESVFRGKKSKGWRHGNGSRGGHQAGNRLCRCAFALHMMKHCPLNYRLRRDLISAWSNCNLEKQFASLSLYCQNDLGLVSFFGNSESLTVYFIQPQLFWDT